MWRRALIWAFDLAIISAVLISGPLVVYSLGLPPLVAVTSAMPGIIVVIFALLYMPVRCAVSGSKVRVCAPLRCKEFEILEWVEEVKRGLLPPPGFVITFGWRTLRFMAWSDGEFYFSTDKCDGTWRRARARSGKEEQILWICCG